MQSVTLRPLALQFTKCHTTAMSFSVLVKPKREIREPATFAGLSAFMHERGWPGVVDSEDEQPLCASAAHRQGWAAVDELGDLDMDDIGKV